MKNILVLLAAFSLGVSAQSPLYDQVPALLQERDLDLKALREENVLTIMELRQDNHLEDPEIEGSYLWGPSGVANRWDIGISQSFDFPGVYQARSRMIATRQRVAEAAYRSALIDKTIEARGLLIDLAYNNEALKLSREIQSFFDFIKAYTERGYELGTYNIMEVNRARIESVNASISVDNMLAEREIIKARLVLMGFSDVDDVEYPAWFLEPEDSYLDRLVNDPAFDLIAQNRALATATASVNSRMSNPRFTVGYVHEFEEGQSFNGFKLGITLPSFSLRGKKALNESMKNSAMAAGTAAEAALVASTRSAWNSASIMNRRLAELGPVFASTDNVAILTKAFKGGQLSIVEYLNEALYFYVAEKDYLEFRHSFYSSLNTLNRTY